ncbi:hypothetical protein VF13_42930, partial [Nostoc linckia z16]
DLVTIKTDGISQYVSGEQNTYIITVSNAGPSDAYNVHVVDPRPYQIITMNWVGNDAGGFGTLDNVIPVLPAGTSMQYTVTLSIPLDYHQTVVNLINTVTVTSDTPDPVPACNNCTDTDTPRGNYVVPTNNQYTVPELITDVLIDMQCIGISNITWKTGIDYGQPQNGIAYFHRGNGSFPIKEGIVITGGNATDAPGMRGVGGPNDSLLANTGGWTGDTQLQQYSGTNNDASYVKFDFTPLTSEFSFRYLFASEEYDNGSFQCTYTDVFAFILTDLVTNVATNIAVLPTTPPVPVLVTTVHPATGFCSAANPSFFGQYNLPQAANNTAPINLNGQTKVLDAVSTVTAGHAYSIKLVVANGGDHSHNSAVFIEAGSFNIGQPSLPEDFSAANDGTAVCGGTSVPISVDTQGINYVIEWKKDGVTMLDAGG